MKILYITTVGITMMFFKDVIKKIIENGNVVDIACNSKDHKVDEYYITLGCKIHQIDCSRSPLNKGNLKAIKQIKQIIFENKYEIVHCHTPIAGMCARIACNKFRKNGIKVFYTAHGFHFFKGSPLKNWLLYYPVEKICASMTDTLITITKEDYYLARRKMKASNIEYIPGVGIDINKFQKSDLNKNILRQSLEIKEKDFVLLSVGELNKNKNHQVVIHALSKLKNENIHYVVAGAGEQKEYLESLSKKLNIEKQIHLLGYRKDVVNLYKIADVYVLPSLREGLNVSVMEAMASGLPIICGNIRGNVDMVADGKNGFLINPSKCLEYQKSIMSLFENYELKNDMAEINKKEIWFANKDIISDKIIKLYLESE